MRKTDALLRIGKGDGADFAIRQAARAGRPIYEAHLEPSSTASVAGNRWLAFAGIGNPEKFYASVTQAGGEIVETHSFPDHHSFDADDIRTLMDAARRQGLGLITTAKDQVRLATMIGVPTGFLAKLAVLDVDLKFDRNDGLDRILDTVIERFKSRVAS